MTILVTGATGRVGSRFVPRLLRVSGPVRVFARDMSRAAPLADLGADVALGDLRDADSVDAALDGVRTVVHLGAAFRGVSPDETAEVNNAATVDFATAALKAGVARFVHTSTTLVYGPGRGRPATESDEPAPPPWAYPQQKAIAEKALLSLHRTQGLPVRIARLAFVYGDGDPHLAESLTWARDWAPHKRLHMVHHADVAQALFRLVQAEGIEGRIYNVADDAPVTAHELLTLNGERVAEDAQDRPLEDPWDGVCENARIRRELGFRPIHPTVYSAQDAGAL
ncbi:NAD-dependent epimerase/dehydratase family protein [Amycolatopsis sp. cmx-11-51]|uniref:NAD-dependent epimerase/dehydratase family protein n=1 Tax=unclassified Amycolatopsis TaxID=2618356 RepID=UPI0039E3EE70